MSPRKGRPAKPGAQDTGSQGAASENSGEFVPGFAPEPVEPAIVEPEGELPASGLERALGVLVIVGVLAMIVGMGITLFGSWSGALTDPTWSFLVILAGAVVTIGCVLALQSLRARDRRRARGEDAR